ncbi:MAG: hypothetical protein ACLQNE_41655 [Thermoguttaceae bacterium]
MEEAANRHRPPFPAEGMARCICNDTMQGELEVGEVVYLREIPNMGGHCVILRNKKPPLVGYHLDRFELLDEDEDHQQSRSG